MQNHTGFYPVKIVSRSIARKRARRVSWFTLGAGFGLACAVSATFLMTPPGALPEKAAAPAAALPESAPAAVAAAPESGGSLYPLELTLTAASGDTLIDILTDAGAPYEEASNAIESLRKAYDPKKLDVGQNIFITLDKGPGDTPIIISLRVPISAVSAVEIIRKTPQGNEFEVKKITAAVQRKLAHAGGRIASSFYETGVASGIPAGLLNDMIGAYSYDVDFQRDLQSGDVMDVLYERLETGDGAHAGHGSVLFAELTLSGRALKIYRYADAGGSVDYYNEKGESVRKALLRTPINGARITSGFGMRSHPILGYSKMHRGVDFGAPSGTPIYAAGDGVVEFAGRKGGYGNYLRIKHNGRYASAYGHISRFAGAIAPGRKVKQGQIVAYVGATGMATGPHLHYEILANNEQVNPSGIKFKAGNVLKGKEMAAFRRNMEQIHAQLEGTPRRVDLALAD